MLRGLLTNMKYLLYLLGLAALSSTSVASDPVCIVGAGPTGLTAARKLQEKGIDTVIFEKNPEAGGKCQSYYDNGHYHPLGAILFTNKSYSETLDVINDSGVSATPFHGTPKYLFDWKNGKTVGPTTTGVAYDPLFAEEVARYTQFWDSTYEPKFSMGYKNGVDGFTQSTASWLTENNYPRLLVLFSRVMAVYGHGDPTEVPILYTMRFFAPDVVLIYACQAQGYIIGVWVRYAAALQGPINYNVNITNIDRSEDSPPVITYDQNGQTKSQSCSKLILAFAPVLHALEAANLELDDAEKTVFEPVGTNKYWSAAVRTAIPSVAFLVGELSGATQDLTPIPPTAEAQPVEVAILYDETDIAITYSWGKYRSNQTAAEARELLVETVSKLNKNPNDASAQSVPITDDDVLVFTDWDYFPHYDQEQLEQGYYAKFNELQGHQSTYYASGFSGFDIVEFAIRAGQDVVASYF